MSRIGHTAVAAHMNGDCWPPSCACCEWEDNNPDQDDDEDGDES
jgi:hypothetical protein